MLPRLIQLQADVREARQAHQPLTRSQIASRLKPIIIEWSAVYTFSLPGTEEQWMLVCAPDISRQRQLWGWARMLSLPGRPYAAFTLSSTGDLVEIDEDGMVLTWDGPHPKLLPPQTASTP